MSRQYASFEVIVHYPSSEECWKDLRTRVAQVHADKVNCFFENLNWSSEDKIKLIDAVIEAAKKDR